MTQIPYRLKPDVQKAINRIKIRLGCNTVTATIDKAVLSYMDHVIEIEALKNRVYDLNSRVEILEGKKERFQEALLGLIDINIPPAPGTAQRKKKSKQSTRYTDIEME